MIKINKKPESSNAVIPVSYLFFIIYAKVIGNKIKIYRLDVSQM